MRQRMGMVGLLLCLAACQVSPVGTSEKLAAERTLQAGKKASTSTTVLRKAPSPGASAAAQASPSPASQAAASPGVAAAALPTASPTVPPWGAGPMKSLSGKTLIDAAYALKMGGNLIANNGGGLISNNAGGLISNNSGAAIAIGSGLIANNGGGLISDHGLGYRLLAQVAVEPGLLLPVKGMMVTPYALTTGAPIGPTVLTDASGTYTLQIPEGQQANFWLVASVPGKSGSDPVASDPRLRYNLILPAAPKPEQTAFDEDTALVSKFLRLSFLAQFDQLFSTPDDAAVEAMTAEYALDAMTRGVVTTQFKSLANRMRKAHYAEKPAEKRAAVCQALLDVVLAHVDWDAVKLEKSGVAYTLKSTGPTLPTMVRAVRQIRLRSDAMLDADPQAFAQNAPLLAANANRSAANAYQVLKGADYGEFLIREYLCVIAPGRLEKLDAALATVDLQTDAESGDGWAKLINACGMSVAMDVMQTMMLDKGGAKTEGMAAVDRIMASP